MTASSVGLLLFRLVVGGLFVGHGSQKLFGWFGGFGFSGTRSWLGGGQRLRPAWLWAAAAGLSELAGGALVGLGFLTPLGALGLIAAMLMATALVHWPRLWLAENGMEYPLVIIAGALLLILAGPGSYSIDALLGLSLAPWIPLAAGTSVVAGMIAALVTREPQQEQAELTPERKAA